MSHLGPTIASLRKERKLSLQKLANATGMTKGHLWELEQSHSANPTLSTFVRLSDALGVSPLDLFKAAIHEG